MRLSPAARRGLTDAGLASFVAFIGLTEVLSEAVHDPQEQWAAAVLITAGALLARRRAPLVVLLIILALQVPFTTDTVDDDPGFQFLSMIIGAFAVAAYAERRQALAGLAVAAALYGATEVTQEGWDPVTVAIGVLFVAVAGALGFGMRHRRELEGERERLESEREASAAEAVADERARIARELHDAVAHSVSVMVLQAGAVRHALGPERERERQLLEATERSGREAMAELHRMLGILRSAPDDEPPAPSAGVGRLSELVADVREAGLPVTLDVQGAPVALPPGLDRSAYRIVQEALTNVLKHAGRVSTRVTVRFAARELRVDVVDDGGGSPARINGDGGGHGLVGMRERVNLYDGELHAGPRESGGFEVSARLPVKPE